jgi:hypothetical protein
LSRILKTPQGLVAAAQKLPCVLGEAISNGSHLFASVQCTKFGEEARTHQLAKAFVDLRDLERAHPHVRKLPFRWFPAAR